MALNRIKFHKTCNVVIPNNLTSLEREGKCNLGRQIITNLKLNAQHFRLMEEVTRCIYKSAITLLCKTNKLNSIFAHSLRPTNELDICSLLLLALESFFSLILAHANLTLQSLRKMRAYCVSVLDLIHRSPHILSIAIYRFSTFSHTSLLCTLKSTVSTCHFFSTTFLPRSRCNHTYHVRSLVFFFIFSFFFFSPLTTPSSLSPFWQSYERTP